MNSRDRIKKLLDFKETDRVGIGEFLWAETIERWLKEGFPEGKLPEDYFGYDFSWIMFEQRMGFEERVLREDKENKVIESIDGVTFNISKGQRHFPQEDLDLPGIPIDYRIKEEKDWKRYKHLFTPAKWRIDFKPKITPRFSFAPESLSTKEYYDKLKKEDKFILFTVREGVENIRTKLSSKNLLFQFAYNPSWVMEMFEADANMTLKMYEYFIEEGFEFDGVWIWGDIAYKNGGYFSPSMYKKVLMPYHKKIFSYFREKNMHVVYHTDGNIEELLPLLVDAGITALQPLEVKAGMDAVKLKKKYGKNLALIGNIDARELEKDKVVIEEEIKSKILLLKEGGGYIFHSDHSIPPNVSFENYKFALECAKKYGSYM